MLMTCSVWRRQQKWYSEALVPNLGWFHTTLSLKHWETVSKIPTIFQYMKKPNHRKRGWMVRWPVEMNIQKVLIPQQVNGDITQEQATQGNEPSTPADKHGPKTSYAFDLWIIEQYDNIENHKNLKQSTKHSGYDNWSPNPGSVIPESVLFNMRPFCVKSGFYGLW